MVLATFVKELKVNPFNDSLIQNWAKSMAKIRERATTHIEAKEAIQRKKVNKPPKQERYKKSVREHTP